MSIPASNIVQVTPRVIGGGGNSLQINGLLLTDNIVVPAGKVLEFYNASDVTNYFTTQSIEGSNASYYFSGFDNSFKKPKVLYIARYSSTACSGWIRGAGSSATLAELQSVTSGSLTIKIDGTDRSLTAIDLSAATSFSGVATILTTALSTYGTVTYTSQFNAFVVTSSTTGASSSVDFATTGTLAGLLGLQETDGGVKSIGLSPQSIGDALNLTLQTVSNWVTFTTTFEATDQEILSSRNWAKNKGLRFWAVNWVKKNSAYLSKESTGHIAETLKNADLGYGNLVCDSLKYALFEMGAAASVDYDASSPARGKIIYMFKAQSGLPFNVDNESDAEALKYWGISFYGDWATANDNFKFFAAGNTFGTYNFIDTAIDAIWLNSEIQLSLVSLLTTATALPYNEEGYTRIMATLQGQDGPVFKAINNGVIRSGVTLSQTQRDQVNLEAGLIISPTLEMQGYYIQVKAPSAAVRQQRGTPDINLWYTDAGGIQKIEMTSSAVI